MFTFKHVFAKEEKEDKKRESPKSRPTSERKSNSYASQETPDIIEPFSQHDPARRENYPSRNDGPLTILVKRNPNEDKRSSWTPNKAKQKPRGPPAAKPVKINAPASPRETFYSEPRRRSVDRSGRNTPVSTSASPAHSKTALASKPIHSSQTGEPVHASRTHKPVHASRTHEPMHANRTEEPMHASRTPELMHASRTHEPLHASRIHEPMHASRTHKPMHVSRTPEPMHVSRTHEPLHTSRTHEPMHDGRTPEPMNASHTHERMHSSRTHKRIHSSRTHKPMHSSRTHKTIHASRTHEPMHSSRTHEPLVHFSRTHEPIHSNRTQEPMHSKSTHEPMHSKRTHEPMPSSRTPEPSRKKFMQQYTSQQHAHMMSHLIHNKGGHRVRQNVQDYRNDQNVLYTDKVKKKYKNKGRNIKFTELKIKGVEGRCCIARPHQAIGWGSKDNQGTGWCINNCCDDAPRELLSNLENPKCSKSTDNFNCVSPLCRHCRSDMCDVSGSEVKVTELHKLQESLSAGHVVPRVRSAAHVVM